MNRLFLTASTVAAVCSLASPAFAQTKNAKVDETAVEDQAHETIVVTGRFLDSGASSATKLDVRVLDTPFSVDSYNSNFLKAIETSNVSDLYRYMTGVQRAGNTAYDLTLRGFKTSGGDRSAIMTDGLPGQTVRFGSPPTIGVDHVELVKGPTSVLYGQAQPGGFVNIISKKPLASPRYEVDLKGTSGLGTYDRAKGILGSVDATGPIDSQGNLLYRMVAEVGTSHGFREYSYEHPIYVAPSLTWNIADATKLELQGEYRHVRTHYDQQSTVPLRIITGSALLPAPNVSYQSPTDVQIERGTSGTARLLHKFSDDVKLNLSYRYVDHFDSAVGYDPQVVQTGGLLLGRRARNQENRRSYGFFDGNLQAKFETLGIEHKFLIGGSVGKETSDFQRLQFYNSPAAGTAARAGSTAPLVVSAQTAVRTLDINILNPVHNELPLSSYPMCSITVPSNLTTTAQPFTITNPDGTSRTVTITKAQYPTYGMNLAECGLPGSQLQWRYTSLVSKGAYVSDLLSIGEYVKVMLGLRYADENQYIHEKVVANVPDSTKHDTAWLPQGGLLIQPTKDISFYGSYSTSFVPVPAGTQDTTGSNASFKPTKAKAYEFGAKADLFDRKVHATAAYFDIKKLNTLNTFACALGTCAAPIGSERSTGVEFEISGNLVEGWNFTMGYAHTNARVTASNVVDSAGNAVQVGARLPNSPRDTFNLWSRYDFQSGALKNLGVGVGVSYVGDRVGYLPVAALPTGITSREQELLRMPAYTLVDLGLYYKASKNLDLTLKASNLFDKRFYESTGSQGDITMLPGKPRELVLSARYTF